MFLDLLKGTRGIKWVAYTGVRMSQGCLSPLDKTVKKREFHEGEAGVNTLSHEPNL